MKNSLSVSSVVGPRGPFEDRSDDDVDSDVRFPEGDPCESNGCLLATAAHAISTVTAAGAVPVVAANNYY